MTALFVSKFKRKNKCPQCPAAKAPHKSLCATHLEKAKLEFRRWSVERREAGRCIGCERASFRGELRCVEHKAINRRRCERWMKAHPNHSRLQWLKIVSLRKLGLCSCRAHNKLSPGQIRCDVCIARVPAYRRNVAAVAG